MKTILAETTGLAPLLIELLGAVTFEKVILAIGAIVILSRIIVMATPTPKDDTAFAKVVEVLKKLGLYIPLLVISLLPLSLTSCANEYFQAEPGFYKPALPSDPEAEFGVLVKQPAEIEAVEVEPGKN